MPQQGFVETLRSFVNTWECDENDHLNVQFYVERFDLAARFFGAQTGAPLDAPLPHTRHVRFHAELRAAAVTRTRSAVITDGAFEGYVVHMMDDMERGILSATAIDAPSQPHGHGIGEREVEKALPRGLEIAAARPMSGPSVLAAGGLISFRAIVNPAQCDAAGNMLERHCVGIYTDAAPHVWNHAGIGTDWLRERGYGRVAVEMKITHHAPARVGDGLLLYSMARVPGGKTLRLRHEMVRLQDGEPLVTAEIVAVVLDHATRRTVELPPGLSG